MLYNITYRPAAPHANLRKQDNTADKEFVLSRKKVTKYRAYLSCILHIYYFFLPKNPFKNEE